MTGFRNSKVVCTCKKQYIMWENLRGKIGSSVLHTPIRPHGNGKKNWRKKGKQMIFWPQSSDNHSAMTGYAPLSLSSLSNSIYICIFCICIFLAESNPEEPVLMISSQFSLVQVLLEDGQPFSIPSWSSELTVSLVFPLSFVLVERSCSL